MSVKGLLKAVTVIPLLIGTVAALYETVRSIDDDPEIKAEFDAFKHSPKISQTLQTIKVQVAVIRSYARQLT